VSKNGSQSRRASRIRGNRREGRALQGRQAQVQVQPQARPKPADPSDAPTVSARLARVWFS
jgi:hypothetical protein